MTDSVTKADALFAQARADHDRGALEDAVAGYDRALAMAPRHAAALFCRGNALLALGRLPAALDSYDTAVALAPSADAFSNRGVTLNRLGRRDAALASFDQALAIEPRHAGALYNRGNLLASAGQPAQAMADFDRALAVDPSNAVAHNGRGNALYELDRPAAAVESFDRAIALQPRLSAAHLNRGNALRNLGRLDEAEDSYRAAIAADAGNAVARKNLADLALLRGDFSAFAEFDRFRNKPAFAAPPEKDLARIEGPIEDAVRGRTVLLLPELGYGDAIWLSRYALELRRLGAKVMLAPHPPLRALMTTLGDDVAVVAPGTDLSAVAFDLYCHLFSLPLAFGTTADAVPHSTPYLHAGSARIERWSRHLGQDGFKIGVCWQGSVGRNDIGRSFPAAKLQGLASIPGVRLISLHKGAGLAQLETLPPGLVIEQPGEDFEAGPDGFLDTAALIGLCDLVVSSDTAVAHLAGALAAPGWIALKHIPAFVWGLERADSPWYPSLRLFRQPAPGDWNGVFAAMEAQLRGRLGA